jgi:hypothetical protein
MTKKTSINTLLPHEIKSIAGGKLNPTILLTTLIAAASGLYVGQQIVKVVMISSTCNIIAYLAGDRTNASNLEKIMVSSMVGTTYHMVGYKLIGFEQHYDKNN